jgi:hypothetical protein
LLVAALPLLLGTIAMPLLGTVALWSLPTLLIGIGPCLLLTTTLTLLLGAITLLPLPTLLLAAALPLLLRAIALWPLLLAALALLLRTVALRPLSTLLLATLALLWPLLATGLLLGPVATTFATFLLATFFKGAKGYLAYIVHKAYIYFYSGFRMAGLQFYRLQFVGLYALAVLSLYLFYLHYAQRVLLITV